MTRLTIPMSVEDILRWLHPDKGVTYTEFLSKKPSIGKFAGVAYSGTSPPSVSLPNRVPEEFNEWVTKEVASMLRAGAVEEFGPSGCNSQGEQRPRPRNVSPLTVRANKTKAVL